jgi:hypothetical protein
MGNHHFDERELEKFMSFEGRKDECSDDIGLFIE